MNPEWIGYLAGLFITSAYVPQAIKTLKERNTKSLSLGMYVLVTSGNACWLVYGILIDSPSIMVANIITFMLTLAILVMKIRHG